MNTVRTGIAIALLLITTVAAVCAQPPTKEPARPLNQKSAKAQENPGERAFQSNCGRCHDAPEQLSPSISGTVVRHMRVRANLSAQDERDILRYLAPRLNN